MASFDFFCECKKNKDAILLNSKIETRRFIELKAGFLMKDKSLKVILTNIKQESYTYFMGNHEKISQISGIHSNNSNEVENWPGKLPKFSFVIKFNFELKTPYFSKDDDEFYTIQNPILKETNFKVPMIRGSGWKGALAHAFREVINEANMDEKISLTESFLRIFGAGSETIKTIEDHIKNKVSNPSELEEAIKEFILFELGLEISIEDLRDTTEDKSRDKDKSTNLLELLKKKIEDKKRNLNSMLPSEFQSHRGRAIFYPTYFDRLSLEVINPHDRRRRAGTQPIYYEVVPKETEGIFQLVYIPFDGILKSGEELKKEVKKDLNNLLTAIEKLQDLGIGAKTKLGWGKFKILHKEILFNEKEEKS